jgi:hypothetical protein
MSHQSKSRIGESTVQGQEERGERPHTGWSARKAWWADGRTDGWDACDRENKMAA